VRKRASVTLASAVLIAAGYFGGAGDRQPQAATRGPYSIVRQAIIQKLDIAATYAGRRRLMSPHVIGTKNGRRQALFYQFGGSSGSGLPPGGDWRCMAIVGLSGVSSFKGVWHTGRSHTRPQTCVDVVDVVVR
jgi:hypothetical protein